MSIPVMGDFRDQLGLETVNRVHSYADLLPDSESPCYIVVCAKVDRNVNGKINATIQHYKERPPALLGLLVWYADKRNGVMDFVPELSLPPDVPLDPKDISDKSNDSFEAIAEMGKKHGIILS